jgi:hypothetical protein
VAKITLNLIAVVIVALLVNGFAATEAGALDVDLTGIWIGQRTCKGISGEDGTKADIFVQDATVQITQNGSAIFFHNNNDAGYYNGQLVEDADTPAKTGTLTVVSCNTNTSLPRRSEIVQLDYTNNVSKGVFIEPKKLKGNSVLVWDHGDQFACTWTLTFEFPSSHPATPKCP